MLSLVALSIQGMQLGLQTLAAGGSAMVGTLQGGKGEICRLEVERDDAGNMTDKIAFDNYLTGIRKQGADPHLASHRPYH